MRKLLQLVLILLVAAAGWLGWSLSVRVQPRPGTLVLLRPGWSTRHIAEELQSAGVIRSADAFLLLHYGSHRHKIKAGEYKFDAPASALEVQRRLEAGDIYIHTVVIPEGYNIYDIAAAMEQAGLASREDFLRVARSDVALVADLDPHAQSLEGYLFPDTYSFTRTQSLQDMTAVMVHRFRQVASSLGLTSDFHRVVTMASIVEKETATPEERPLVAAVYYNRLEQNVALDADPSVIYAAELAGNYHGAIHQSDLQADSPYNTYKHAGLPPGPIANPGRASLLAAMQPAQSSFLYFVSDGAGHHRFARTLEEHSRNVAAYRRAVNANR